MENPTFHRTLHGFLRWTIFPSHRRQNRLRCRTSQSTQDLVQSKSILLLHIWLVVFRHPSEKYEFVNWDDDSNPILMGKCKIDGNQTINQFWSIWFFSCVARFDLGRSKRRGMLWKHTWSMGSINLLRVGVEIGFPRFTLDLSENRELPHGES